MSKKDIKPKENQSEKKSESKRTLKKLHIWFYIIHDCNSMCFLLSIRAVTLEI